MARSVARRSRCTREQIGAVIVDPHQRVLATAYTGPPAGMKLASEDVNCAAFCTRSIVGPTPETARSYTDCFSIHAEVNALLLSDRSAREGGSMYVTSCPCWGCAKAVANSGLHDLWIVDADLEATEYRDPAASLHLLRQSGLIVRLL